MGWFVIVMNCRDRGEKMNKFGFGPLCAWVARWGKQTNKQEKGTN